MQRKKSGKVVAFLLGVALVWANSLPAVASIDDMIDTQGTYGDKIVTEKTAPSAPTVAASAQAPAKAQTHVVQKGECLLAICRLYGVKPQAVLTANKIEDANYLPVGEKLQIPAQQQDQNQNQNLNLIEEPVLETTSLPASLPALAMSWPVQARISSPFGIRGDRPHYGIDLAAAEGTVIRAPREGRIIYAGLASGYGNLMIIDHGDHTTSYYGHCSRFLQKSNAQVKTGDPIALVGSTGHSTGPHLHWEVRYDNVPYDPELGIDVKDQSQL